MENILKEILSQVKALTTKVDNLTTDVSILKTDVGILKTDVGILKTDVGILKTDVGILKTDVQDLQELKPIVFGLKDEHGRILRAILESQEVHRGEIDTLNHRTAKLEGSVKGAAKILLNDLKEVSNQ